jgi:hypothetical protein
MEFSKQKVGNFKEAVALSAIETGNIKVDKIANARFDNSLKRGPL